MIVVFAQQENVIGDLENSVSITANSFAFKGKGRVQIEKYQRTSTTTTTTKLSAIIKTTWAIYLRKVIEKA